MNDEYVVHPPTVRWTHIALPATDLDKSIDWYRRFTPLELLDRRVDADGLAAWLGDPDQAERPFVLVLVSLYKHQAGPPQPIMTPFAHLGIEVPRREDVDEIARRGEEEGCLVWAPAQLPPPVGYVCALADPDGNLVEFSYDQGVYAKAQEVWGAGR